MFKVLWETSVLDDVDAHVALQIKAKVDNYLAQSPQKLSKPLLGIYKGLYRYRYGNYRVIFEIFPDEKTIAILKVGHRSKIYD